MLLPSWHLIGALLVLTATAGDATNNKIILPQILNGGGDAPGKHPSGAKTANGATNGGGGGAVGVATGTGNTVVGSNGVIVAGGGVVANGPTTNLNTVVEEPEFTEYIENVTVPAGRNVKLGCSVKNLGSYKVAWMHFEQSAILTVHNHVITRNPRISVTHDKHDRHRTWYLHINNVHEEDKGRYMCQINTVTAKTQFGYLNVVVPPNIDDSLSSSDVIVREGANISLRCRASGSPRPIIKWKRDDNSRIAINKNHIVNEWEGDTLEITRISRLDMGAYLCIASNGVPPTVSKRIKVSVDFPPMLLIPHQLVGAPEGFNVTIECFTEAHPTSLNYWTRGEGPIIHDSHKYKVESSVGVPAYKTHMKLTIISVSSGDDGIYKCVAKNPRGETDGIIRLYVSYPPTTVSSGTTDSHWERENGINGNNYAYGGSDGQRSSYGQDKNKTQNPLAANGNGNANDPEDSEANRGANSSKAIAWMTLLLPITFLLTIRQSAVGSTSSIVSVSL
ncbi:lachesin isoform X2 [Drosophila persimilis]|uniref:Lachesin isoform X2 n=1 Tax=Drosophila pseudoobscura pseudoobscura TaxID=46245 RepID=A0A6I8VW50_DROPS|nr:lachesin isoform X2 [Drosophila persimilis]XP_033235315.1 lachesin isoform X2 [Drosophila pseudoobscura]